MSGRKRPTPHYSLGTPRGRELREILTQIYFNEQRIVGLLRLADLSPGEYNLNGSAHIVWGELLTAAASRMEIEQLLDTVERDRNANEWHERLKDLRSENPTIEAEGQGELEPADEGELERILGRRSTLLDIAFLSGGIRMAPSVVRLTVAWGNQTAHGSGVLIGERRILTNHHVLFRNGAEAAERVQAVFNYQRNIDGTPASHDGYEGCVGTIFGEIAHDWAVIDLSEQPDARYPPLRLRRPSLPAELGARVYIIQHPLGNYKQIGMHNNVITHVSRNRIQYMTDTERGSSGSPVFNERWEIVALHHRAVRVAGDDEEPGLWETAGSSKAGSYDDWGDYRNQGVRIERVLEGLHARNQGRHGS